MLGSSGTLEPVDACNFIGPDHKVYRYVIFAGGDVVFAIAVSGGMVIGTDRPVKRKYVVAGRGCCFFHGPLF